MNRLLLVVHWQLNVIFLSFKAEGENKYLNEVQELIRPERNTLTVSFNDIESYNSKLSTIIQEEYYR